MASGFKFLVSIVFFYLFIFYKINITRSKTGRSGNFKSEENHLILPYLKSYRYEDKLVLLWNWYLNVDIFRVYKWRSKYTIENNFQIISSLWPIFELRNLIPRFLKKFEKSIHNCLVYCLRSRDNTLARVLWFIVLSVRKRRNKTGSKEMNSKICNSISCQNYYSNFRNIIPN